MANKLNKSQKCVKCKSSAGKISLYTGQKFCSKCFCAIIEGRIRKELGKVPLTGKKILIAGSTAKKIFRIVSSAKIMPDFRELGFFQAKNALGLLNSEACIDSIRSYAKKNKIDVVILPWTADMDALCVLDYFFGSTGDREMAGNSGARRVDFMDALPFRAVRLFREISAEELITYCREKKIHVDSGLQNLYSDFNYAGAGKRKISRAAAFLRKMEKLYPGTVFSLAKSIELVEKRDGKQG